MRSRLALPRKKPTNSTTMPHTTSAQRVAGLRGRLYAAQNKYQATLREADALERQLLMIAAERAKTEALLLARKLAAARSPKLSLSRRDHEREASVLAAAAAKASTHLARLARFARFARLARLARLLNIAQGALIETSVLLFCAGA